MKKLLTTVYIIYQVVRVGDTVLLEEIICTEPQILVLSERHSVPEGSKVVIRSRLITGSQLSKNSDIRLTETDGC